MALVMGPCKQGWQVVLNVLAAGPEWWSLLGSYSLVKTDSLLCELFHEMSEYVLFQAMVKIVFFQVQNNFLALFRFGLGFS